MTRLNLRVVGVPAPQGSKKHVGRGIMVEASKKVAPWREAVAAAGQREMEVRGLASPLDGPLHLAVTFRLPMPKSRPKRDHVRGWKWSTKTPDLDKLLRSTCDALKMGGVIADDARICQISAEKIEAGSWTGMELTIEEVSGTEDW